MSKELRLADNVDCARTLERGFDNYVQQRNIQWTQSRSLPQKPNRFAATIMSVNKDLPGWCCSRANGPDGGATKVIVMILLLMRVR